SANNTSSSYGYDAMDRVTSISHTFASVLNGSTTRTLGYDYDNVGNRKWMKRDGGNGDAYSYDLNDQVTAIKQDMSNPDATGAAGPRTIIYDANGNRTSFSAYGSTDTYGAVNNLNQYTSRTGSVSSPVYDNNGNMTRSE